MKNISLNIPDMQSTHCQARVSAAIQKISGVQIQQLEARKLAASFQSDELESQVTDAIERAGYTVVR